MDTALLIWFSFLAGAYAPVGSPCVIVLYPGYLAFLAGSGENGPARASTHLLGAAVAAGVILSLLCGGILFSAAIHAAGPAARAILQPVTSALLLAFALALILDIPSLPRARILPAATGTTPYRAAFLLGLFFGIIILPCNTAIILVLLTFAGSVATAAEAAVLFLAFGAGMVLPLLVLAALPRAAGLRLLRFLARHRRAVQLAAGTVMLAIAVWYLALFFMPAPAGP